MNQAAEQKWEQRWHPLRREWVVIAGHRNNRPWQGEVQDQHDNTIPSYDPNCYLCPGNQRVSGARNDDYQDIFVFENDHPCVGPDAPQELAEATGIYQRRPATGIARVVCYGPEHHLRLAQLPSERIDRLLHCWQDQYRDLGARPEIKHVLFFENNGDAVGVSNPHPHCQIYATNFIFSTIAEEVAASREHLAQHGRPLFQDIISAEQHDSCRILAENDSAIAFLPFFARYAYEVYVAPKRTVPSIADLTEAERTDLAGVLKTVLCRFDNLWRMPFPYVMALHNAPTDDGDYSSYHFHIQLHPPLRKPNLLKYLAGPEIGGGNFISDTWPEDKAAELLAVPTTHYRDESPAS